MRSGGLGSAVKFRKGILQPFVFDEKLFLPLLVLYVLINGLILYNSFSVDYVDGYDGTAHIAYIRILAQGRLPAENETHEFFSPPVPYAAPALATALAGDCGEDVSDCLTPIAGEVAQLLGVAASVVATYFLIKLCRLIRPTSRVFAITSLSFLGILTVYYKSFAFIRGEPYVLLFSVLLVYVLVRFLIEDSRWTWQQGIVPGILMGLLFLSRQWGILVGAAVMLWLVVLVPAATKKSPLRMLPIAITTSLIGGLLSGWFYILLLNRYGSMTTFNKEPIETFSTTNHDPSYFVGLGDGNLFTDAFRSSFDNQIIPIFYSEMWGDYWGYFYLKPPPGLDSNDSEFQELVGSDVRGYLGRVNLVSLYPTALLVTGIGFGLFAFVRSWFSNSNLNYVIFALMFVVVLTSLVGYGWFLISYPNPGNGNTIKATYMLQIFPFLALFTGETLTRIYEKQAYIYYVLMGGIVLVFLHNLPAIIVTLKPF